MSPSREIPYDREKNRPKATFRPQSTLSSRVLDSKVVPSCQWSGQARKKRTMCPRFHFLAEAPFPPAAARPHACTNTSLAQVLVKVWHSYLGLEALEACLVLHTSRGCQVVPEWEIRVLVHPRQNPGLAVGAAICCELYPGRPFSLIITAHH